MPSFLIKQGNEGRESPQKQTRQEEGVIITTHGDQEKGQEANQKQNAARACCARVARVLGLLDNKRKGGKKSIRYHARPSTHPSPYAMPHSTQLGSVNVNPTTPLPPSTPNLPTRPRTQPKSSVSHNHTSAAAHIQLTTNSSSQMQSGNTQQGRSRTRREQQRLKKKREKHFVRSFLSCLNTKSRIRKNSTKLLLIHSFPCPSMTLHPSIPCPFPCCDRVCLSLSFSPCPIPSHPMKTDIAKRCLNR